MHGNRGIDINLLFRSINGHNQCIATSAIPPIQMMSLPPPPHSRIDGDQIGPIKVGGGSFSDIRMNGPHVPCFTDYPILSKALGAWVFPIISGLIVDASHKLTLGFTCAVDIKAKRV